MFNALYYVCVKSESNVKSTGFLNELKRTRKLISGPDMNAEHLRRLLLNFLGQQKCFCF